MDRTPRLNRILEEAESLAKALGLEVLGVEHVVLCALQDKRSIPTQVAQSMGIVDDYTENLTKFIESEKYSKSSTKFGNSDE